MHKKHEFISVKTKFQQKLLNLCYGIFLIDIHYVLISRLDCEIRPNIS